MGKRVCDIEPKLSEIDDLRPYFYFSRESLDKKLSKVFSENKEKYSINVIIVAKTIKTIFDFQEKKNSNFEDLTGVYYIHSILKRMVAFIMMRESFSGYLENFFNL